MAWRHPVRTPLEEGMSKRRKHWLMRDRPSPVTLCNLSAEKVEDTYPKGGALLAEREEDVDCRECQYVLEVRKFPALFETATPIEDPRKLAIGTPVVICATAYVYRARGEAERKRSKFRTGRAVVTGWTSRLVRWTVSGGSHWDDEAEAHALERGNFVCIKFSPRGRERLCFPDDVRVLAT